MIKKDEALKLALEALAVKFSEGWHDGIKIDASDIMLLTDAAQALAEQPAQRTWVGLTEEDENKLLEAVIGSLPVAKNLIRAIEAKLREKNT